jgi:hypothetical protein
MFEHTSGLSERNGNDQPLSGGLSKGTDQDVEDISVFIDSIRINDSAAPPLGTEQSIGEVAA